DKLSDPTNGYANVLGIPTLQTGVFGGIIIGALAAWCYNKFYNITLPSYLGFFAGKRFVQIMMATTSFILAFPMAIIWPTIQNGLNAFSE
ncbi:PTS transporter subunit EIIC, partial [Staphylococcus hominis]|uniref:PTS transporter subunit EIIC n=1 Tax=Staphylococcus hominis TaxID=1290 RepID=UPI0030BC8AFB